ncbi:MAG: phosphoenolpyruvate--protein phosphotransferase [Gemmatimonadetes bacterium]|nr:phosphoenolpyruvate--protein phosphotransferase [Gemmatimonadota bacterium]MDA1104730.1 phosphoenolpyruvate--protein phosphotransferase [Gemmatimonadota bacterium]
MSESIGGPVSLDGSPASEGIGAGKVFRLEWGVPVVPHRSISDDDTETELGRFHDALAWAKERLEETKAVTEERLGSVEARIFDPQILMLRDSAVVDGTTQYVRENRLSAERAFELRMLELRSMWSRTSHPMVLDRLNDLEDLMIRVLHRLLGKNDPTDLVKTEGGVIVVAPNLTPSLTVQLELGQVVGIATDHGTRTAHWAMLARALQIPAVVGLGDVFQRSVDGQEAIVDGRIGRVVLNPGSREKAHFEARQQRHSEWEQEIGAIAALESVTLDGQVVELRANLDLPGEAGQARDHGAEGIGLFRTEFLVVGRNTMPGEEEQYEAYRATAEAFPDRAVYIRTFDLGGDKFPMFLHMPQEANPFLGWRAIRVCLDQPELFRTQLRALLRATAHGDVRLMLPLVNDVEEIQQVRALLEEEEAQLARDGIPYNRGYKLGVMIETPAAALHAAELARHSDFFSIGTNDLVQYTLAVDRTNTRLAKLYNPFHPAVVKQLHQIARVGRAAGIEVSVCGELASSPLGAFLLLGLDITALSMAWPSLPEIKKLVRDVRMEDARSAARKAIAASSSEEVIRCLLDGIGDAVDVEVFSGRWSLSLPD